VISRGVRSVGVVMLLITAAVATARAQGDIPEKPQMPGAVLRPRKQSPCVIETSVRGKQTADGVVLEVVMRNRSSARVALTLRNPCPSGAAQIIGLPRGYDVYSVCKRGACVDAKPIHVVLAAGAERTLATATIRPQGDSCNAPLPSDGLYYLAAQPLYDGAPVETCSTKPYRFVVDPSPPNPHLMVPGAPPIAPSPKRPSPIPCALGCPNGVLDSVHCTCTPLGPKPPPSPPHP
jgi:hypothetical protein